MQKLRQKLLLNIANSNLKKETRSEERVLFFYINIYLAISLATRTPLAEAWEREWVIPLPSPMM